jgi:hypothetical protein
MLGDDEWKGCRDVAGIEEMLQERLWWTLEKDETLYKTRLVARESEGGMAE